MSSGDDPTCEGVPSAIVSVSSEYEQALKELVIATLSWREKVVRVVELGRQIGRSNAQIRADIISAFQGKIHQNVIYRYLPKELKDRRHIEGGRKGAAAAQSNRQLDIKSGPSQERGAGGAAEAHVEPGAKTAQSKTGPQSKAPNSQSVKEIWVAPWFYTRIQDALSRYNRGFVAVFRGHNLIDIREAYTPARQYSNDNPEINR